MFKTIKHILILYQEQEITQDEAKKVHSFDFSNFV